MTNLTTSEIQLSIGEEFRQIVELDELGFTISPPLKRESPTRPMSGEVVFEHDRIPVEFQIRRTTNDRSICQFIGLPMARRNKIHSLKQRADFIAAEAEELKRLEEEAAAANSDDNNQRCDSQAEDASETKTALTIEHESEEETSTAPSVAPLLTTTQVAETNTKETVASTEPSPVRPTPQPRRRRRSNNQRPLAKTLLPILSLLLLGGIAYGAWSSWQSGKEQKSAEPQISSSQMVISAQVEGRVEEVFFQPGDLVKKGDTLLRLSNPDLNDELVTLKTNLDHGQATVAALNQKIASLSKKLSLAKERLTIEIESAQSEMEIARDQKQITDATVSRLKPHIASGAITRQEMEQAQQKAITAAERLQVCQKQVAKLNLLLRANQSQILTEDERLGQDMEQLKADLALASADVERIEQLQKIAQTKLASLEIKAPESGRINFSLQPGDYLRYADQVAILDSENEDWQSEQVSANLLFQ